MKVIKISAVWCPSCIIMDKVFKKVKVNFPNLEVIDYDYDLDEDEIAKYDVKDTLPVMIFMEDEKEVKRLVGEVSYEEIEKVIK